MLNYFMRTIELLCSPTFRIALIVLGLFLLPLAIFCYGAYRLSISVLNLIAISWLVSRIRTSEHRLTRRILILSILPVILWTLFYTIPEFNFLLTSSARQRLVDDIVANPSLSSVSHKNNLFLGQTTTYKRDGQVSSVYFTQFKSLGGRFLGEAAFFVYTTNLRRSIALTSDRNIKQLKKLKENCFFLVRGYAD